MANIFQRSLNDLLQELRTGAALKSGEPDPTAGRYGQPSRFLSPAQGRLLQAGEPAPTPYVQPFSAQAPATPVWNPNAPSPQAPPSRGTTGTWNPPVPAFSGGNVTTMQPTGDVSGRVPANMPPVIPSPSMTPTGQVTGAPTGTWNQSVQPTGNVTGAPTGPFNATPPNKVTHTVESDTGKTVVSHQAKPPKQTGEADYRNVVDPDARYLQAAAASQGGGAPAGPAPAVPTAPAVRPALPASQATGPWTYGAPPGAAPQGQGQNVNLQVPAHPGLLERIGQTISHFFGGTLGQHQQPAQQPASPYRPGYGPPESNALSGVSRALASGRQQVATHGGSAPASAPPPPGDFRGAIAQDQGAAVQPTSPQALAYTETGEAQPLGDTNIVVGADGKRYRVDVSDPRRYTLIQ